MATLTDCAAHKLAKSRMTFVTWRDSLENRSFSQVSFHTYRSIRPHFIGFVAVEVCSQTNATKSLLVINGYSLFSLSVVVKTVQSWGLYLGVKKWLFVSFSCKVKLLMLACPNLGSWGLYSFATWVLAFIKILLIRPLCKSSWQNIILQRVPIPIRKFDPVSAVIRSYAYPISVMFDW